MLTLAAGIIIGLVLGLTGAGGSIFALPLLILLLGLDPKEAAVIALSAVAASAIFGTLTRLRGKSIAWLPALMFALIGSLFTPLGGYMNKVFPPEFVLTGFTVIVFYVAWRMWKQAASTPEQTKISRARYEKVEESNGAYCRMNHKQEFEFGPRCFAGMFVGASITGVLSGLFGVGGGFIIVPTLMFLTGISIQQAVATSLPVISFISVSALFSHFLQGNLLVNQLVFQLSLGGLIGMLFGLLLGKYLVGATLQKIFSVAMIMLSGLVLARYFQLF